MTLDSGPPRARGRCTVCGDRGVIPFLELFGVVVHCNRLHGTRADAIAAPRGDIQLGLCAACGHVLNLAFDPDLIRYVAGYENSLHFSSRFERYAAALADRLIEKHGLTGKDIVEIGCGQGEFLAHLCARGDNRGYGFDPSRVPSGGERASLGQITFIRDYFSEDYANLPADLICCRHVLEHVEDPTGFLRGIRRILGNRTETAVFFEVPSARFVFDDLAVWDIIYEHASYFSQRSLEHAFALAGFAVKQVTEAYEGQFLQVDAVPTGEQVGGKGVVSAAGGNTTPHLTDRFPALYRQKVDRWRRELETFAGEGRRAVVWGVGSKGVTFLNTVGSGDLIEHVVDINPRKQGAYVPGTGQRILGPEALRSLRPDAVIVMNPIYLSEVETLLRDLGVEARCLPMSEGGIAGDSDRLVKSR